MGMNARLVAVWAGTNLLKHKVPQNKLMAEMSDDGDVL